MTNHSTDLVDRYHGMAEELNGRGAMELAVPFYRQTIALLLAERERWRSLPPASEGMVDVMEAASQVEALAAARLDLLSLSELMRRVGALEEELCEANQLEVAAAVADLEERWGEPQAQLLGLRAKLHLLAGDLEAARCCFLQAHDLDGDCERLQQNAGAACLACGDAAAAVRLLRPLAGRPQTPDHEGRRAPLLRNLAQAELEAGDDERALAVVLQLLEEEPEALDVAGWLSVMEAWTSHGQAGLSRCLLAALLPRLEDPAPLLPLLAASHEALGEFREAALIYRDLLRPSL